VSDGRRLRGRPRSGNYPVRWIGRQAHLAANDGPGTRVGLWAGEGYRWLQVFTGDPLGPDRRRKAVAIEPMTCPPNAFVTADDLLVLEPGEAVTHTWGIQVLSD